MSSRRNTGHSRQKRTPSSGRGRSGVRVTPPHGNDHVEIAMQDEGGLIDWNVTPPRQHDRSSGSANSRAQIAGIFLGGLDAGGRASTAEPSVLAALSEDPPGAAGSADLVTGSSKLTTPITGGCDCAGLDLLGAQFAVVSAGGVHVLDDFEIISEDAGDTTFPADDELAYIGGDSDSDSDSSSDGPDDADSDDLYNVVVADDDDDDESTDEDVTGAADPNITGGAIDILEDLLRDDLYYTGGDGDDDAAEPVCHGSSSIADDYKTAALLA